MNDILSFVRAIAQDGICLSHEYYNVRAQEVLRVYDQSATIAVSSSQGDGDDGTTPIKPTAVIPKKGRRSDMGGVAHS